MVMTQWIGAHLTNDEKRAHLLDLKLEHLIDQVCIQEILPPEETYRLWTSLIIFESFLRGKGELIPVVIAPRLAKIILRGWFLRVRGETPWCDGEPAVARLSRRLRRPGDPVGRSHHPVRAGVATATNRPLP